jgi:hypothetical protein
LFQTKGSAKKTLSDLDLEEKLTIDELVLLHGLATKFEDEKWIRISSKFFDKTGKRINLEDERFDGQTVNGKRLADMPESLCAQTWKVHGNF